MFQEYLSGSAESLRLGDEHGSFSKWHPPTKVAGRGGAGNIHTTITPTGNMTSTAASGSFNAYSFISFGRLRLSSLPHTGNTKPRSQNRLRRVASFGRGGAGNNRGRQATDASNEPPPLPDITELEKQYLLARDAWRPHQPQSSGRGGAGNIKLPRPIARAVQIFVSVSKL